MALIVKKVKGAHTNKDAVENLIRYILEDPGKLTQDQQITGGFGLFDVHNPESVIQQFHGTKELFHQTEGRQCVHLVISFGPYPSLPRKKIKKKIDKIVRFWQDRYELFWGVHCEVTPNGQENYHCHICLNSVDMITGNKLEITPKVWHKFCKHANRIWKDVRSIT